MTNWNPTSWQDKNHGKQPNYADSEAIERAVAALSKLPPLVSSWEIETLKSQLADAANGKRFCYKQETVLSDSQTALQKITGQLKSATANVACLGAFHQTKSHSRWPACGPIRKTSLK